MNYTATIFTHCQRTSQLVGGLNILYVYTALSARRHCPWTGLEPVSQPSLSFNRGVLPLNHHGILLPVRVFLFQLLVVRLYFIYHTHPVNIKHVHFIFLIKYSIPFTIKQLTAVQTTSNNVPAIPIILFFKYYQLIYRCHIRHNLHLM